MAAIPIVDTQDKRVGLISSVGSMLILFVVLLLITYEMADPPPKDHPLKAAEPLDVTMIEHVKVDLGGGGGGTPSDADPGDPRTTEHVLTSNNSSHTVNSGNATHSTTHNSNNPPAGNNVDNPFGTGGNGTGSGTGNGSGIGNDSGPGANGNSPGNGGGTRELMAQVNADDIRYNYDVKFVFNVAVNADGYVVDVSNVKAQTTTNDQTIINKVIELVKKQVRYSKSPGATVQTIRYQVNFTAR